MADILNEGSDFTDAVPHDRFDAAIWEEILTGSSAVEDLVDDLSQTHHYVQDLARDTFNLLAKAEPEVRGVEEMRVTHIPVRQVISELLSLPELKTLRLNTVGDEFVSAMGLLALRDVLTKAAERADAMREQADEAQGQQESADQAKADADASGDSTEAQEATEAQERADAARQQLQAASEALGAGLRQDLRRALTAANDEAEETAETGALYGIGPGEMQRMSFRERADLARRLSSEKLRKFAALIGQFKALAAAEYRRRVTDVADEAVGIELGDDLTRLITQETINLATPELEDDFWRRYANRELQVKKLRGREHEGRGPMICVVDESGSMAGAGEMWSKGLALALLDQATKQKRDFHYIGFSHGPLREFDFPKGHAKAGQIVDMAEGFLNGGTDFNAPMRRALDLIVGAELARPDIVFITDGDAPMLQFQAEWNTQRRRLSAKCFGIYVSSYGEGRPPATLSLIADDVRTIHDLTDADQVRDIMRHS